MCERRIRWDRDGRSSSRFAKAVTSEKVLKKIQDCASFYKDYELCEKYIRIHGSFDSRMIKSNIDVMRQLYVKERDYF